MAHTEGTGKSLGVTCVYGTVTVQGWTQIVITETGKPVAQMIDKTAAGDGSYVMIDDPLGGQGSPSSTVKIDGLMSIYSKNDENLLNLTVDAYSGLDLIIRLGADQAGIWEWTAEDARYTGIEVGGAFAQAQPFSASWALDDSAGVWGDSSG